MSENIQKYLTDLAQNLYDQKNELLVKTSDKNDLFELMCYKIINYCVSDGRRK